MTKKWNTDNIISSEISVEDKLVKGLKLTVDSTIAAQTGSKSGVVKAAFKKDHVNVALDANVAKAPIVNGSAVVGYQGVSTLWERLVQINVSSSLYLGDQWVSIFSDLPSSYILWGHLNPYI